MLPNSPNVYEGENYIEENPREFKTLALTARIILIIWGVIVIIMGVYLPIMISSKYSGYTGAEMASQVTGTVFPIVGTMVVVLVITSFYRAQDSQWTNSAILSGIFASILLCDGMLNVGVLGLVLCITALLLLILSKTQGVHKL